MPAQPIMALGQMIGELAVIQHDQAETNRQFLGGLQAQVGRQAQALEQLAARPAGLALHQMTAEDDAQSFLEAFEAMAEACGWPAEEWPVRLLPLWSGEAQTAAMGLPPASVRKAVIDRLGLLPEDHHRRFRQTRLEPEDRPFVYGQRLKDATNRWLLPNSDGGVDAVMEKVVLEQFAEGLPTRTAAWVKYRPPTLKAAITLAEDHLAVHPSRQRDQGVTPSPARPAQRGGGQQQPVERPVPAPQRTSFLPARYPLTAESSGALPDPTEGLSNAGAGMLEVWAARTPPERVSADGGGTGDSGCRRSNTLPRSGSDVPRSD
ncbi:uncharacterized protein LOC144404843 isoform X2 [Gasterosteus aculeatus]